MAVTNGRGARLFSHGSPGIGNVGSYQASGVPYMTGSTIAGGEEHKIVFPTVAKSILIVNKDEDGAVTGAAIRVHFNSTTDPGRVIAGFHYYPLFREEQALSLNVKCKEIYVSCPTGNSQYFIVAELTGIETGNMFALTGSGLTD
jgi:hypothetical protein